MSLDYKRVRLIDIGYLTRAKKGLIYPKGSTLIQIRDIYNHDLIYLHKKGEVESKFAVFTPIEDFNSIYIHEMISREMKDFLRKYQTGADIQIKDLKELEINIHTDKEAIEQFAKEAGKLYEYKMIEKNYLRRLEQIKDGIFQELF